MNNLTCPNCNSKMSKVIEPDITFERCSNCKGTFLGEDELNGLITGLPGNNEYWPINEDEVKDIFPVRKCPKCSGKTMEKISIFCYTDVIFDYCKKCEGFFLDGGEINKINNEFTEDKISGEYRGYLKGFLVRLDKVSDVCFGYSDGKAGDFRAATIIKISIFFNNSFNLGLRVFSEKWTDKFLKVIKLSKKQDIIIGNAKLDTSFIIQGNNPVEIASILSSEEIQEELLNFVNNKPKIFKNYGKLEILDDQVVYTEGPYLGKLEYSVEEDPAGVVDRLLRLALLFDGLL